jgi:hypothetical protein
MPATMRETFHSDRSVEEKNTGKKKLSVLSLLRTTLSTLSSSLASFWFLSSLFSSFLSLSNFFFFFFFFFFCNFYIFLVRDLDLRFIVIISPTQATVATCHSSIISGYLSFHRGHLLERMYAIYAPPQRALATHDTTLIRFRGASCCQET